jgi:hypothetical protein
VKASLPATLVLACLLGSCGASANADAADAHAAVAIPAAGASAGLGGSELDVLEDLRVRLSARASEWALGSADGPKETQWGHIVGVVADGDSVAHVLDAMLHTVRTVSMQGTVIGEFGREGDGPGELRTPVALASDADGHLVVGQRSSAKVFRRDGGEWVYDRSIGELPSVFDLCLLGETIFLRTVSHHFSHPVVSVDLRAGADRENGFDAPSLPDDPWLRSETTLGRIACAEGAGRVVAIYDDLPYLHAFDPDGTLRWEATIEGFQGDRFETLGVEGRPAVRRRGDEPSDRVLGAVPIGPALLVQVARVAAREPGQPGRHITRRDSYLVSLESGRGMFVGSDLPQVTQATEDRLWAVETDPDLGYLKLTSYRY